MTLKKKLFRSNMTILLSALFVLLLIMSAVIFLFKDQFERRFNSLDYAELDSDVLTVAAIMDKGLGEDWRTLDQELARLNYELLVTDGTQIVYGTHRREGEEFLQDFSLKNHRKAYTEIFYIQGMTMVGRYDAESGDYAIAVGGTEEEWWLIPLERSADMIMYILLIGGILGAAAYIWLSNYFTHRFVQKITEPLEVLEQGAKRIREGRLDEPICYQGEREFEQLCETFNEMQAALAQARQRQVRDEKARTDMITGISHDLRTPLTSIQGYIKGILDGVANNAQKQERYLNTAYDATVEMNILLQKLFDFSRMESGQMPFHMIQGDLAEFAASWIAKKEAGAYGDPVIFRFARGQELMPDIRMDIDQIRRILDNLLENSLKYAGILPVVIALSVYTEGNQVILAWKDNGNGVPEEKLGRIFERFYRCDEARQKKGSGIGLYVVKWIMEQHGGSVSAENQGGLLVKLYFPRGEG